MSFWRDRPHFTNEKLRHREGRGLSQAHTPEGDGIQAQAVKAKSSALPTRPEPGGSLGRGQVLPQGWLSIRECWSLQPLRPHSPRKTQTPHSAVGSHGRGHGAKSAEGRDAWAGTRKGQVQALRCPPAGGSHGLDSLAARRGQPGAPEPQYPGSSPGWSLGYG